MAVLLGEHRLRPEPWQSRRAGTHSTLQQSLSGRPVQRRHGRSRKYDCRACRLKPQCCPKEPARYVPRSIYEGPRDMARQIANSWEGRLARRLRKKVEMLFAHLKRILNLGRLRLRGPNGAHDEFLLAATAQNLRKLAKLIPLPSPQPA